MPPSEAGAGAGESGPPPRFARGRAVLTVDLGALRANYLALVRAAAPAAVAGVVKADGYGLGAAAVARTLLDAGCRTFFVAQLDEGLALRAALSGEPGATTVYVLNGLTASDPAAFAAHRLRPVLNHPGELEAWAALARRRGERLPAALHLDTGMCRLGFDPAEVRRGVDRGALDAIDLALVMSHLACAEDGPEHPLNRAQVARFEALRRLLPAAPASLANSPGVFLGAAARFDLCRPGVALYGANPTPAVRRPNPMRPVVRLEAPVLQVHAVEAPGTVGYGATYPTRAGARIATVPVGYADGVPRRAGGRASARIGGRAVPYAGRVSMDLITLDVTGLPEDAVRPGTAVELIGGPDGVDELAAAAETIPYEILTRLGSRFERRYVPAAAADDHHHRDGGGAEAAA